MCECTNGVEDGLGWVESRWDGIKSPVCFKRVGVSKPKVKRTNVWVGRRSQGHLLLQLDDAKEFIEICVVKPRGEQNDLLKFTHIHIQTNMNIAPTQSKYKKRTQNLVEILIDLADELEQLLISQIVTQIWMQ